MSFLQGFGAFAGGLTSGMQQAQALRSNALAIQQQQMQLDAAKRNLAAQAAAFHGMQTPQAPTAQFQGAPPLAAPQAGPQAAPTMQQPVQGPIPPAPGQASVPLAPRQATATGAPPPAMQPSPQAPAPQGPAGGALGADQSQPQMFDPFSAVMKVAAEIKQNNPGIDDLTLFQAVQDRIAIARDVNPDMRMQMQWLVDQQRLQIGQQNAAEKARHDQATEQAAQQRIQAGLQETSQRIQASLQRTQYIQGQLNQRFAKGELDKNATTAARTKLADAKAKLDAAKNALNQFMANVRASVGQLTTTDEQGNVVPNPQLTALQKQTDDALANFDSVAQGIVNEAPAQAAPPDAAGSVRDQQSGRTGGKNIPDTIPLPASLKNLKEGQTTDADQNGIRWQRKGDRLVKVRG